MAQRYTLASVTSKRGFAPCGMRKSRLNGNFGGSQPLLLALNGICVHSLGSILSVARGCTQVRMRRSVPGIPGRLGPAQSPNNIAFLDVIC